MNEKVKKFRIANGFSCTYVAKAAGISLANYINFENGKANITLSTLYAVLGVLGCDVDVVHVQPSKRNLNITIG